MKTICWATIKRRVAHHIGSIRWSSSLEEVLDNVQMAHKRCYMKRSEARLYTDTTGTNIQLKGFFKKVNDNVITLHFFLHFYELKDNYCLNVKKSFKYYDGWHQTEKDFPFSPSLFIAHTNCQMYDRVLGSP